MTYNLKFPHLGSYQNLNKFVQRLAQLIIACDLHVGLGYFSSEGGH